MKTTIIDDALKDLRREFPDLDGTAKGIVYSLFFLSNQFTKTGGRILEQFGLTWGEYLVVSTLRRKSSGTMSPSAICDSIGMSSGGLSNLLQRLEADGLVKRCPSARDGRGVTVSITARGRKQAERALFAISADQTERLTLLDVAERERLYQTLRELVLKFETNAVRDSLYDGVT